MDPQDVLTMADERFERRLTQESGAIRQEIAGVRQEVAVLRQDMTALRQEMATRQDLAALRQEMATREDLAALHQEFAQLNEKIGDWRADIIKWSFLFWTGQFFTTAGFLPVILRIR